MRVRDMTIGPASTEDVTRFCKAYHYTNTGGTMNWRYGLYHEGELQGVVAYNLPTRRTCESVFGKEHYDKVWHMGRLALSDDAPRNSESKLIAGSMKLIHQEYPYVWGVLTFAATDVGHIGYVYQATNAIYTGTGGRHVSYLDPEGRRRSDYLDGRVVTLARGKELGWTRQPSKPKHRYLYVLGNKTERKLRTALMRYEPLPYPKAPLTMGPFSCPTEGSK